MRNPDQLSAKTDHQLREQIKAAIEALPLKDEDTELAALNILQGIYLARFIDQPKLKPISQKAINRQLDELARLATGLSFHIANMHHAALFPVEKDIRFINSTEFHEILGLIAASIKRIDRKGPSTRGPKVKCGAVHLGAVACAAYEECTGKRATITTDAETNERRGNFVQFVRNLFAAAGIKADAVKYAKQAADIRRKLFGTPMA